MTSEYHGALTLFQRKHSHTDSRCCFLFFGGFFSSGKIRFLFLKKSWKIYWKIYWEIYWIFIYKIGNGFASPPHRQVTSIGRFNPGQDNSYPRFHWEITLKAKFHVFFTLECRMENDVAMARFKPTMLWSSPHIKGQNKDGYFTAEQFAIYWAGQIANKL